jgi:hypothetical protein
MAEFTVIHKEVAGIEAEDREEAIQKAIEGETIAGWETSDYEVEAVLNPLPENWEATPGERGEGNYTKWYANPTHSLEITQYTDPNEPHTILVEEIEENEDGDVVNRDRIETGKADSESQADLKAVELMEKYSEGIPE